MKRLTKHVSLCLIITILLATLGSGCVDTSTDGNNSTDNTIISSSTLVNNALGETTSSSPSSDSQTSVYSSENSTSDKLTDSNNGSTNNSNNNNNNNNSNNNSNNNNNNNNSTIPPADSFLNISVLDIGQGLSVLLNCDNHYLLYDGADGSHSSFVVSYLSKHNITNLDYMVASHYDSDHISGLVGVIYNYSIGTIIAPNYTADSRIYNSFMNAINSKNYAITYPQVGATYSLGNAKIQILAPNKSYYENENDYSVAIKVSLGDQSVIITGDATALSENEMLDSGYNLKSDILVVGHHGSSSSNYEDFLDAVDPSYAAISCGLNNSYGHPADVVLNRLNKRYIFTLRTDLSGTINYTIKNGLITYSVEKHETQTPTESSTTKPTTNNNTSNNNTSNNNTSISYVLNTNTKKFHNPGCRHVNRIHEENKAISTDSRDTIIANGYTPSWILGNVTRIPRHELPQTLDFSDFLPLFT